MSGEFRYAFVKSIPIIASYFFFGASYALLAVSQGISIGLTIAMSFIVYAGSLQFAAVNVLNSAFDPIGTALLSLMINARHIFYGMTMLKPYSKLDWKKTPTIAGLTDETFSVGITIDAPDSLDINWIYFHLTWLNYSYWIIGTVIGITISKILTFEITGLEFVPVALFVTLFLEQWLSNDDHTPAIIGIVIGIVCRLLFGSDHFMIPAMICILSYFLVQYRVKEI